LRAKIASVSNKCAVGGKLKHLVGKPRPNDANKDRLRKQSE